MGHRLLWLDAIRVVAAQLIVLHHLSIYGPLGRSLHAAVPDLIDWLEDYGRVAVQVFLVIGGLLCAQSAARVVQPDARTLAVALGRRFLRLFVPLYAALALVLIAAIPGREWLGAGWVPQWPDLRVLGAHLAGLQDYLGIEALSAGTWYVTIDFQLHAVVLGLLWLVARIAPSPAAQAPILQGLVFALAAASLFWINRNPDWDVQPLYFFGSFALGFAAGWLGSTTASSGTRIAGLAIFVLAMVALVLDWRLRIAVALVCALVIVAGLRGAGLRIDARLCSAGPVGSLARQLIVRLADISYPLFLAHFSLCILANAGFVRWTDQGLGAAAGLFVAAWLGSVPLAIALRALVEKPLARRMRRDDH